MSENQELRSSLIDLLKKNIDPGTFLDQVRALVKPTPEELGRKPAVPPAPPVPSTPEPPAPPADGDGPPAPADAPTTDPDAE